MNHSDKYWDRVDFWLWVSPTLLFHDSCSLIADEFNVGRGCANQSMCWYFGLDVWCCSCCIVDVCLGVAEYQTDCTWCNNFRRLRCFHNDFSGFCHVAESGWRFKIFAIFRICGLGFSAFASTKKFLVTEFLWLETLHYVPSGCINQSPCFAAHLVCNRLASALLCEHSWLQLSGRDSLERAWNHLGWPFIFLS